MIDDKTVLRAIEIEKSLRQVLINEFNTAPVPINALALALGSLFGSSLKTLKGTQYEIARLSFETGATLGKMQEEK